MSAVTAAAPVTAMAAPVTAMAAPVTAMAAPMRMLLPTATATANRPPPSSAMARTLRHTVAIVLVMGEAALPVGCRPKATATDCDLLLERYAGLVVEQKYPDASAAEIAAERQREKSEARGDDAFKNCSSEVSRSEFDCAMRTDNTDAFEKCLE